MDLKIEVVTVPVADVDRAKRFYAEQLGFVVDLDTQLPGGIRLVQLTPPGSGCSIQLNTDPDANPPGPLKGMVIVVADVDAARAELMGRDVDVTPVQHLEDGVWKVGRGGPWNSFLFVDDPDGNKWVIQERPADA
jgi:catechol 2,3-dioxygenase-like lactoylglutathione lyase family enzyme